MAAPSAVLHYDSQQICDYVLLRHANVVKDAENEKTYKKWTKLWVVAHCQISPSDSFICYCKKESQWLKDDGSITKYTLDDFSVSMISTKKHDKVVKVEFPLFTLELSFESQTKMDLYFKLLSKVSMRHHVDLVRAPEHPDREGDYIIEDCSDSYRAWKVLESGRGQLCWDWNLRTIRRIHYHKNVEKLEIEAGRMSETGEGHFFFTGRHAYRLFEAMKTELVARAQQKMQSQNKSLPSSLEGTPQSNLSRSASSASAMNMKQKHPLAATTSHAHNSSSSSGHKPLAPHLSHSNGALPAKSSASLDESETSSEDYSASDNSSSFTGGTGGTGGSLHDWTTPSPILPTGNGLFERPPLLPPRMLEGRPFSPCSTSSSSSSSTSGYNVPRRAYLPPTPLTIMPRYMHVKRTEIDEDNDYMTMNSALRRKTPPTDTKDNDEEEEDESEEEDEEYVDGEYAEEYTNMHSAAQKEIPDQYMRMVPIGGAQVGTLTRDAGDPSSSRSSSVPPSLSPQMSSRFREVTIIDSSNTFPPSTSRDSTNT